MIKLVKNELKKIFSHKSIYILAGMVIFLSAFTVGLKYFFEKDFDEKTNNNVEMWAEECKNFGEVNDKNKEDYVDVCYTAELSKYYKPEYGVNSYQYYLVDNELRSLVKRKYVAKYIDKNNAAYEELEKQIKEFEIKIEHYDYKAELKKEINEVNKMKPSNKEETNALKARKEALQYRIDNDIPYSYSPNSSLVDNYEDAAIYYYNNKDKKKLSDKDKIELEYRTEQYFVTKYQLSNNKLKNDDFHFVDIDENAFIEPNFFILLFIVSVITILIAEEFNKGTIKTLLISPFTRCEILGSKLIAFGITLILFMVFLVGIKLVENVFLMNDASQFISTVVKYNFSTGKVFELNIGLYYLYNLVALLPHYLIVAFACFLMGIIVPNSIAIISTGIGLEAGLILTIQYVTAKGRAMLPLYNSNLNEFLFGSMGSNEYGSLNLAVLTNILFMIILLSLIFYLFKKKDITNQ